MCLGAACFVMSAHEPVALITQWVGTALHGDTIPWGGTPELARLGTRTYIVSIG